MSSIGSVDGDFGAELHLLCAAPTKHPSGDTCT